MVETEDGGRTHRSGPLHAGRLAAKLFLAAGALTMVNNNIPPVDHLNLGALYAIALSAIACGVICWFAPWDRWPAALTLVLGPIALGHIAAANLFGGVSAYSYAVYFVVVFAYIGVTQPARTSLYMAPIATAAYVIPPLIDPDQPLLAAMSATVAIPVCIMVGEVISRVTGRAMADRRLAERRADLLSALAHASGRINSLDSDRILDSVIDAAFSQGAEAAQVCMYDEERKVARVIAERGFPASRLRSVISLDAGLAGQVWSRRGTVVLGDPSPGTVERELCSGLRAWIASPIWSSGRLVGVLIAGTRMPGPLPRDVVEAFELLAALAGQAMANAELFDSQRRTVEQLAELDRLKEDFLSNISHELRTPLTVIEGMGLTLENRWDEVDPDTRHDLLRRLNRNAQALNRIISSLLDFSRLRAGRIRLQACETDLSQLCVSVASRLDPLFEGHELVLRVDSNPTIEADPVLLERVLENLLANAAKYTPKGTRVELSTTECDAGIEVCVSDDGPGIPEEDLRYIGNRFFRGGHTNTRKVSGTGLGLAFSRELLLLHDSQLSVSSETGRGTRFSFVLKLAESRKSRARTA